MALLKNYSDLSKNINFQNAYFRVKDIILEGKNNIFLRIEVFNSNGQVPTQNLKYFDKLDFSIYEGHPNFNKYFSVQNLSKDGNNIFKSCYEFLKNEEAFFNGASDL